MEGPRVNSATAAAFEEGAGDPATAGRGAVAGAAGVGVAAVAAAVVANGV